MLNEYSRITFSVCSLCRDDNAVYNIQDKLRSVFPAETEFFILNNSTGEWDCYDAIRYFLKQSKGDYIVIIHDDIGFGNLSVSLLIERISEVINKDPSAALFGVAGISSQDQRGIGRFHNSTGEQLWGFHDGGKASSLDECFLVVKGDSEITVSEGLKGYHFYGTDLCLNAMKLGHSIYVIDYPLIHKSAGNMNESFFEARDRFEEHLKNQALNRYFRTTCTVLYGGVSLIKQCWALALSYVLIEEPKHQDFDIASQCLLKRGSARYGWVLFQLMIQVARLKKAYKTFSRDVKWWGRNWKQHLTRRLSWTSE
jgi:hypothetical protein